MPFLINDSFSEPMEKINTIKYVFVNKQPELKKLVVKYGLKPATNEKDLWKKVNYLVLKRPELVLRDLAAIHPDRDLILASVKNTEEIKPEILQPKVEAAKEATSNACGCSHGADGSTTDKGCSCNKKSNADGDKESSTPAPATTPSPATTPVSTSFADNLKGAAPILLMGVVVLAAVYFGTRVNKG